MLSALGPTNSCPLTNDQLWVSPGHSVCKCPLIIPRRTLKGLPGGSVVKNPPTKAGDVGSIPGSGSFLWRRKWQPTPVLLPREPRGQRSLAATVHGASQSQTRLKQHSTHACGKRNWDDAKVCVILGFRSPGSSA